MQFNLQWKFNTNIDRINSQNRFLESDDEQTIEAQSP